MTMTTTTTQTIARMTGAFILDFITLTVKRGLMMSTMMLRSRGLARAGARGARRMRVARVLLDDITTSWGAGDSSSAMMGRRIS